MKIPLEQFQDLLQSHFPQDAEIRRSKSGELIIHTKLLLEEEEDKIYVKTADHDDMYNVIDLTTHPKFIDRIVAEVSGE